MAQPGPKIVIFWQMAQPRIASHLVNSDCFLFLLILTKFCTRATAGGAAMFQLNAAIFKAMWLTHTHTLTAHCRWRNAFWEAKKTQGNPP